MQKHYREYRRKNIIGENLDLLDSIDQLVASADKQRNPRIRKRVLMSYFSSLIFFAAVLELEL